MPKGRQVEKRKVIIDGDEWPGLIRCAAINREEDTAEIPGFDRIVIVKNGIKRILPIGLAYRIDKNSSTLSNIRSWQENNETHDVIVIRTDGGGIEFERILFSNCECRTNNIPDYDAATPAPAQMDIEILPEDYQVVSV